MHIILIARKTLNSGFSFIANLLLYILYFIICTMKKSLFFLLLLSFVLAEDDTQEKADLTQLTDWIASKRMVTIKELGGNLSLSGDIRTEFFTVNERKNNIKQVGPSSQNPQIPDQAYKVKHNFLIDYRTEMTWCTTKVRFEYNKHTITDTGARVKLERAVLGTRVFDNDAQTIDLEFGRSKINYSFDSRLQFGSYMDGILCKFSQFNERLGQSYLHAAAFIINEMIHQYGYIGEVGVLNVLNTGLYLKYSLINWDTKTQANSIDANRFRFTISQLTAGYKFIAPKIDKSMTLFGAYLVNTQAKPLTILHCKRQNKAYYAGFTVGRLAKKGDWSLSGIMEHVEAQSIPSFDLIGVGKGNSSGIGLYSTLPFGKGNAATVSTAVGDADYNGWLATFSYLITGNLSISQTYKQSRSLGNLADNFRLKVYFFEVAYAF